jgi:serine/threonine protein kinase
MFENDQQLMLADIDGALQNNRPGAAIMSGKFTITECIKGGSHAVAFKGARAEDEAPIFIKMHPQIAKNKEIYDNLIDFRKPILSINHANLLHVIDTGLCGADWWEVCEWHPGRRFTEWLTDERQQNTSGQPSDETIASMIEQIVDGLHAMHEAGLVHRDLKPANILVTEGQNGQPKFTVVDYSSVVRIDKGGVVLGVGTPEYAPPEFKSGGGHERCDLLRSWDYWTLGRILQEVIDGVHHLERLRVRSSEQIANIVDWLEVATLMSISLEMMSEVSLDKYGVHAGAVEFSEYSAEVKGVGKWMPLLRGLLTFRRTARWGYNEVKAFLSGRHVPDAYYE